MKISIFQWEYAHCNQLTFDLYVKVKFKVKLCDVGEIYMNLNIYEHEFQLNYLLNENGLYRNRYV